MVQALRYSQLPAPWQILVRICQDMNFGQIRRLPIRDNNPVLDDPNTLRLSGERLDKPDEPRPEAALSDFCLSKEWCQLLARLDETGDVIIDRINVSAGIPRRVVFEQRFPGPEMGTSNDPRGGGSRPRAA